MSGASPEGGEARHTASLRVPFNRPALAGREMEYIQDAVRRGHLSGDGWYTRRCHELLREILGAPQVLLTTSCTHALELAAMLLEVGPGDEVILPAFTFVSTANAFVLRGAHPVFADIRPDTLNLDEEDVARKVTPRTRAIVPVHYAGVGCEMESLHEVARQAGATLVEDAAHALFGSYRNRSLGTFGSLAALSFHETKNVTCGEGGALVINDPALIERAEILREKGTNRSRFFRGEVDRYTWMDVGSSYLPSDLLAAVLLAQLEAREESQRRRREIWETYAARLGDWAAARDICLPVVPDHCQQPYHLFYLLFPTLAEREQFSDRLRHAGVYTTFHYLPLHLSQMGRRFGGRPGDCPVTESVSDRLLRLPLFSGLTEIEQAQAIEVILDA
ncbi:MAG TPA: dTDP-4-amino-4,6-dideoxygalactose transaminase [Thermoanaerobaculia bacterium]|nr:dTDP-4-amino-4,6-dideoxygalactose transaminase [Thermoanaerobaculia bacterium]